MTARTTEVMVRIVRTIKVPNATVYGARHIYQYEDILEINLKNKNCVNVLKEETEVNRERLIDINIRNVVVIVLIYTPTTVVQCCLT